MSGLLLLPATAAVFAFNIFGTKATRATGARGPLILGTVIMTASVVAIGLTVSRDSYGLLLPGLLLGLGIGLLITPMTTALTPLAVALATEVAAVVIVRAASAIDRMTEPAF